SDVCSSDHASPIAVISRLALRLQLVQLSVTRLLRLGQAWTLHLFPVRIKLLLNLAQGYTSSAAETSYVAVIMMIAQYLSSRLFCSIPQELTCLLKVTAHYTPASILLARRGCQPRSICLRRADSAGKHHRVSKRSLGVR